MPTTEHQPPIDPGALLPAAEPEGTEAEVRFKTIATQVEEKLHAELQFVAQMTGTSIAQEVRDAIAARVIAARDDPRIIARAQEVQAEIQREAEARAAAIAGFMGQTATTGTGDDTAAAEPAPRGNRSRASQK